MTIPAGFQPRALLPLQKGIAAIDPRTGNWTDYGFNLMSDFRNAINGVNKIIPCVATGTNLITLTPNPVSPPIERYNDYDIFSFVAANNSTAAVTATVVPLRGTLATVKVYKTNGAAQAGSGDVVAGSLYLAIFNDALDSGAGGLVLK